ncbi:tungsten transporter, ATP binding protein [Candidatus Vecturithrix granuli]|uniref:Tungsten transporter, ATP binding protein n=1 Tax=Vecturithrix granuli TaxID=1499967 RepID=A0A081C7M4_VECG1|nr:tungsten transporter, ATP binding protein [Candidatus Vecturithrix granuli]
MTPSTLSNSIFEIHQLTQRFDETLVLDIEHLTLQQGKIYCLYGPNGAGKTTLFEALTLLRKPITGTIVFNGREIFPAEDGLAELRASVTLVHQDPLLFDTTVEKNVDYGLRIRKMDREMRRKRVKECLQLVGLDGFQKRKARQLSGGETQRVAIARALSIRPAVIFLDEFSANVDQKHRAILENIIYNIRAQYGTTVVFTTHYQDQAYRIADEVIHLFQGRPVKSPLNNIFHGTITRKNDLYCFATPLVQFEVIAPHEGHATVAIAAQNITLSKHPFESSMRNNMQGHITHIIDAGDHVDLKVQAGESFEVKITKDSYHEMELHPGIPVYLHFKATAVEVF